MGSPRQYKASGSDLSCTTEPWSLTSLHILFWPQFFFWMGCRRLFIFILCLQIIVSLLNSYSILIFNLISALFVSRYLYSKMDGEGFRGGAVVESLPANAGDTGSGPGPGGSHMPRSSWARAPQLLSLRIWSLCSATREAAIVRGPRTAMKSGPRLPQLEKALVQKRRPNTAKNK